MDFDQFIRNLEEMRARTEALHRQVGAQGAGETGELEEELRNLIRRMDGLQRDLQSIEKANGQRHDHILTSETERRAEDLNSVITNIPEAVIIFDPQGQILQVNSATLREFGFNPLLMDRMAMIRKLDMRHQDGRHLAIEEMPSSQALKGNPVRNMPLLFRNGRGEDCYVLASASPLYQGDELTGVVSVWRDITENQQRRRELETLVRVAAGLRDAATLDEMLPEVLSQVIELLHVNGAAIAMPDPTSGEIMIKQGMGDWANITGERLPTGASITARVIATGQPYLNNDIQNDPLLIRQFFFKTLTCGACVPLIAHNHTIGALWAGRFIAFSEGELSMLSAIADIAANAIYRVSLYEQTQFRLQRLSALHAIDVAITSSMDLNVTLNILLEQVLAQTGVHAASVLLLNPSLNRLEFAAGRGFLSTGIQETRLRLGESFAGQVALERRVLAVPDLAHFPPGEMYKPFTPEENFAAYFAAPLTAKGQVKGVLELFHRTPFYPDPEWLNFVKTLATQAAIAIDNAELFTRLQQSNEELSLAYDATIEGWSRALELRDQETYGHAERVTEMTIRLAKYMGVRDPELGHYRRGVLLHDIGKMAIPDAVLLKEGPLDAEEWEVMRRHPRYAYELLSLIPYLRPALDIPYSHHEWWDGSGYPRGLKGDQIPLSARIFAVVDVWDALLSERPYRTSWPVEQVMDYIESQSGTQFDPSIVEAFLQMVREEGQ